MACSACCYLVSCQNSTLLTTSDQMRHEFRVCNRATWGWTRLGATVGADVKIGYARVSTKDHAYGLQIDALLAAGRQAGRVAVAGWLRKGGDE